MKTFVQNKVEIAYSIEGKGDTTLLFVYGAFIDRNYWSAQIREIRMQDDLVIAKR